MPACVFVYTLAFSTVLCADVIKSRLLLAPVETRHARMRKKGNVLGSYLFVVRRRICMPTNPAEQRWQRASGTLLTTLPNRASDGVFCLTLLRLHAASASSRSCLKPLLPQRRRRDVPPRTLPRQRWQRRAPARPLQTPPPPGAPPPRRRRRQRATRPPPPPAAAPDWLIAFFCLSLLPPRRKWPRRAPAWPL